MDEDPGGGEGWFAGLEPGDADATREAIEEGGADAPRDWPGLAVDSGAVDSEEEYYEWLHESTVEATAAAASERERAADQQLVHAIRAVDDLAEGVNELAERVSEWANAHYDEAGEGLAYVREVADRDPDGPREERVVGLARRATDLDAERGELRTFVEREAPRIAPNLSDLAGPLLAARLIALAGGLEELARKPSGTLQVLGAEDALFAHLEGRASSPKHGVIYTHDYVRKTRAADRGSAARALAGKLTIAARVDHYSGERRPELAEELDARIERIRSRGDS